MAGSCSVPVSESVPHSLEAANVINALLLGLREFCWQLVALCAFAWVVLVGGALAFVALLQWLVIRRTGLRWR